MSRVVVPVRYPLSERSLRTLERALAIAEERDAELTVFHVDLYQEPGSVTRTQLRDAVRDAVGHLPRTRYVVHKGFMVEESILEEAASEDADVVVVGRRDHGRIRKLFRRVFEGPDVEQFLVEHLDCEILAVE